MSENKPTHPKTLLIGEDWLAILVASLLLLVSLVATWPSLKKNESGKFTAKNQLKSFVGKPAKWSNSPVDGFVKPGKISKSGQTAEKNPSVVSTQPDYGPLIQIAGTFIVLSTLLGLAIGLNENWRSAKHFLLGFAVVFSLATLAYLFAANEVIKSWNLEYALWALAVGMVIANTVGTPEWLKPAVRTEFYIKTGLVLLGAEVLVSNLLALGLPGICIAWVVTPIVLISTYWFGQTILKMESRSLNMVISADMSVCGVSAAIAAAAACKARKEELSLAIGLSLSFTVVMMVLMPMIIKAIGLSEMVGGAWLGGTIDSTGAVAVAGAELGDGALKVAATVKMIQNILIGVSAFGIATYWVTCIENNAQQNGKNGDDLSGESSPPRPGLSEIWKRFPRFILGFVAWSILFSIIHGGLEQGPTIVEQTIKGSSKTLRGWFFCLAFVSIGLDTHFRTLAANLKGGKPLILYLCGQTLNLLLTFLMAYLMFGYFFKNLELGE